MSFIQVLVHINSLTPLKLEAMRSELAVKEALLLPMDNSKIERQWINEYRDVTKR